MNRMEVEEENLVARATDEENLEALTSSEEVEQEDEVVEEQDAEYQGEEENVVEQRLLGRQPRPRRFRFLVSENPFEKYRDDEFYQTFGFSKQRTAQLAAMCHQTLASRIDRKTALSPESKMLVFLDYVRSNSLQRSLGKANHAGLHQSTVCRIIKDVSASINEHFHQFVIFPDERERDAISKQFIAMDNFPGVFGCLDGTHISIKRPPFHTVPAPERFYKRKSRYSINMMALSDHTHRIRYFSVRYPGGVHDARIFNESALKQVLLQQFNPNKPRFILGDEAFPCSNVLLTPINRTRADTPAKRRYCRLVRNSRWRVESCFGVLKSRFRVLLSEQRTSLAVTRDVLRAVVILHNFGIMYCGNGLEEIDLGDGEAQQEILDEFDTVMQEPTENEDPNNFIRQRLIQNLYQEE